MINRRLIRTRVFLDLYSFFLSNQDYNKKDINNLENEFKFSLDSLNNLYYFLLFIIVSTFKHVDDYSLKSELKFNKSNNAKLFSRLSNNLVIDYLNLNFLKNIDLNYIEKDKVNKIVSDIFNIIVRNNSTQLSLEHNSSLEKDVHFLLLLFNNNFLKSQKLFSYIKDNNIYWDTDLSYVIDYINKSVKNFVKTKKFNLQYVEEKDFDFAIKLINRFGSSNEKNYKTLESYSNNWDIERIALIDKILIKLALTELFAFNDIPYKVSINEYIEISKKFSTKKSHEFINGILDKIVHDFKIHN